MGRGGWGQESWLRREPVASFELPFGTPAHVLPDVVAAVARSGTAAMHAAMSLALLKVTIPIETSGASGTAARRGVYCSRARGPTPKGAWLLTASAEVVFRMGASRAAHGK